MTLDKLHDLPDSMGQVCTVTNNLGSATTHSISNSNSLELRTGYNISVARKLFQLLAVTFDQKYYKVSQFLKKL